MGLLPIPSEIIVKTVSYTKSKVIRQIRGNLKHNEGTHDDKILRKTCLQMSKYLFTGVKADFQNTDDLIDNMHRSILYLQKRKRKLL